MHDGFKGKMPLATMVPSKPTRSSAEINYRGSRYAAMNTYCELKVSDRKPLSVFQGIFSNGYACHVCRRQFLMTYFVKQKSGSRRPSQARVLRQRRIECKINNWPEHELRHYLTCLECPRCVESSCESIWLRSEAVAYPSFLLFYHLKHHATKSSL